MAVISRAASLAMDCQEGSFSSFSDWMVLLVRAQFGQNGKTGTRSAFGISWGTPNQARGQKACGQALLSQSALSSTSISVGSHPLST